MKRFIKVFAVHIVFALTLTLINCQKDDNLPTDEKNMQKESLRMTMTNWEHLKHENSALAETVSGLFEQSTQRTLTSEEYGFYLNESTVQVIEHENFTTYTFLIYRDGYTPNEVENYVYKEFHDGSNQQYILTYQYSFDSQGKMVYSPDYLHLLPIEDANLVSTSRGVGGCLPYFEEEDTVVCGPSQFCFGEGSNGQHEAGSTACVCQVTNFTCYPAGTEKCETYTTYTLVTNCGGSNDIPDDNNNGGSGGSGNGSNDDNDEDEEEDEDTGEDEETTTTVPLNYTRDFLRLIDSWSLDLQTFINSLSQYNLKQDMQAFINGNPLDTDVKKFLTIVTEALANDDELSFDVFVGLYEDMDKKCPLNKIINFVTKSNTPLTQLIIDNFFKNPEKNLQLLDIDLPGDATAGTQAPLNMQFGEFTAIKINYDNGYLDAATNLSMAATTAHEFVHTYLINLYIDGQLLTFNPSYTDLNTAFQNFANNQTQSNYETMEDAMHDVFDDFIAMMTTSVYAYATNNGISGATEEYCRQLVWGQLQGTDVFESELTEQQQIDYGNIAANEQESNSQANGTPCN